MNLNDTPFVRLGSHLLDLLNALEGQEIPLIIVGGFGLSLRHQHIEEVRMDTLLRPIPIVRATEDIDTFISLDLLADVNKMALLSQALTKLDFIPEVPNFQFIKPNTAQIGVRNVKIDLLTSQPDETDLRFKIEGMRVKVKGSSIHGYRTPEAIALENTPFSISIEGNLTTGKLATGIVYLPRPYALILMKLFAFRDEHQDRKKKQKKGIDPVPFARKHAGDVYAIIAMTSQEEYETLNNFKSKYQTTEIGIEATQIVQEYFQDRATIGTIRVREAHPETTLSNLEKFLEILKTTFL